MSVCAVVCRRVKVCVHVHMCRQGLEITANVKAPELIQFGLAFLFVSPRDGQFAEIHWAVDKSNRLWHFCCLEITLFYH